ncbi:glycosyltransferase family A protein [Desulfovibrio gilichinskyi]|uniref:Glycosyl transferase family 2 n=1 Tax=Desulfovibrio gilichinskyi TaxID=1519643 RepID=A0A1X7F2L0_9BACT|nr:glycosyltransferase family A protein [Desulfovibrio gilichinskyi]SMF44331.1 Glycosyl transferase family 2 [Desulfovibrio gilichinskyi]
MTLFNPEEPITMRKRLTPRNINVRRCPQQIKFDDADLIVGVTVHNNADSIQRCLQSILNQTEQFPVIILDDSSSDDWFDCCADLINRIDALVVSAHCGSAASARNAILDYVETEFSNVRWVARLDADDRLSFKNSLIAMRDAARKNDSKYVLGGNRLVKHGKLLACNNPATNSLKKSSFLINLLKKMAQGTASNEIPSCNLLVSPSAGWRYPEIKSAEDHWLVTSLLIFHPEDGSIVDDGYYADYTLQGSVTIACKQNGLAKQYREQLFQAAKLWISLKNEVNEILGFGCEGVVVRQGTQVEKHFYPWSISDEDVEYISNKCHESKILPDVNFVKKNNKWIAIYTYQKSFPVIDITIKESLYILKEFLNKKFVCTNISRSNFRRIYDGSLIYIDIGVSISEMDVSYFRDVAARMYAISALNLSSRELKRRYTKERQIEILSKLIGFEEFYKELIENHIKMIWKKCKIKTNLLHKNRETDVTLMIKVCSMDANIIYNQVSHIVSQLEIPANFDEKIILIDPFSGPYLRAYDKSNYSKLISEVKRLCRAGIVDRFLIAPQDCTSVSDVNKRWFNLACDKTHNSMQVPVTPQLWGFDQVKSRYLLQCDVDILVGRRDFCHDYLFEMIDALQSSDVFGIGFNIPHSPDSQDKIYDALPGDYVPEVRCGLFDLDRLKANRPFPNDIENGHLRLSWYRSIQRYQQTDGFRCLRGGSPRTFYVHPNNNCKIDNNFYVKVRDLISQGFVPSLQYGQWDVKGSIEDWKYPVRSEKLVFLLRGRNTPLHKVNRCISSLLMQRDQYFGVILIDDASPIEHQNNLRREVSRLKRATLVCNTARLGHIQNTIFAINQICVNNDTLVAILDLDDALIDRNTSLLIQEKQQQGHDVILGAMYRPDKPLKVYSPEFDAPRSHFGGEVWIHLRSFTRKLFKSIPQDSFKNGKEWVSECEDYAIMVPIVELAKKPVYIPQYLYFHERSTSSSLALREERDLTIRTILKKKSLSV